MKETEEIKNTIENIDVVENIKQVIDILSKNDEYYHKLDGYYSSLDKKINFWLHYIEFNKIPVTRSYNLLRHIQELRNLRRKVKNDLDLFRAFNNNINKLCNEDNRQFLLASVCKQDSINKNKKYSYSEYTEEEINVILGIHSESK